jgi:nucleotide-binding universal stress UspA family protein
MSALQQIVVGFDGSTDATRALEWTLALAGQVGATVVVVHAVGLLEHATHATKVADLEAQVRHLTEVAGLEARQVRWQVADGDPCSVLGRVGAPPLGADLLVVGSRGRGAHAGSLLGSTSHELAESVAIPLLIVPGPRREER